MAARAGPSLEEILGDTPSEKLDQPCRDIHLCRVARVIANWPILAPFLGVKAPEVVAIREKWPYNMRAQNLELLQVWKKKRQRKHKDTYRDLCKAFVDAQEATLASKVCDVLCSLENCTESSSDESGEETVTAPVDPLDPLARNLRMTYGCITPSFVALQWPPPPTLKVFNLAMIKTREVVRRKPLDEELIRLTLRGNVDDIMKKRTSIKLEELFKRTANENYARKDRKVVLIEGAPGAGKSTLAWHICQKWKANKFFHEEFKVVVYVQFRDLNVQSAKEIADLFPMGLESERKDATSLITACHGKGVLFVLDGWDEFSPGLQRDSLFEKLICRPEKLNVQCSTVLITSRPIASTPLQPYATSRVEIVGFTAEEVGRYFEDVFKDTLIVQKLHSHLNDRPRIKASCYLPLNAAIVAHLFIELNHTLPTTLHGLFYSLTLSCIIRHLTKKSETQPTIASLDDLPPDIETVFLKLCLLAYEGTMRNKVDFSGRDLHSYGLPEDLNVLSLMQVVQSFATGKPTSYHFLHLSIQELLAALHISKLPPTEQVSIFNKLFGEPRFAAVFGFYAAFTKLQTEGVRDIVTRIVQSTRTTSYVGGGQRRYLLNFIGDQRRPLLNLLRCLYEAQDTSICLFVGSLLEGTLDLSAMRLSPFDLLSLKYFLSCVNASIPEPGERGDRMDPLLQPTHEASDRASSMVLTELNLNYCGLTSDNIEFLSLCNLAKIKLEGNKISCACAANLLTNNPQLKVVELTFFDEDAQPFLPYFSPHTFPLPSEQTQTDVGAPPLPPLPSAQPELFTSALRQHSSLEVLSISDSIFQGGIPYVFNKSLLELRVTVNDFGSLPILARNLMANKTPEKLVIEVDLPTILGDVELCKLHGVFDFVKQVQYSNLKSLVIESEYKFNRFGVDINSMNNTRKQRGLPPLHIEYRQI